MSTFVQTPDADHDLETGRSDHADDAPDTGVAQYYSSHADEPLAPDWPTEPEPEGWHRRMLRALDLSTVLRIFGAGVMVTAIGVFLFAHWEAGDDLLRYSMLLGQTVLLALLGFGTSRYMREPKSARVFLALGLVSTAASFTIAGALLYSTVQWDAVSAVYPGFAYWRAASSAEALAWIAGSVVVLVPVSMVGYMVLARPAARTLTGLFLANGALLMLPVRDPAVATVLAAGAGILSLMVLARLRQRVSAVRTFEGRVARLIALLPVVVIAGRAGYLYAAEAVSVAALGLLVYATLRQLAVNASEHPIAQRGLEAGSLLPAAAVAMACGEIAMNAVGYSLRDEIAIAVLCSVLVAALFDLGKRSGQDSGFYARGAALLALIGGVLELAVDPSMGTALVCVVVSAAVALYTRGAGYTVMYRASLLCLAGGLGYHVYFAVHAFDFGGWLGLTLLGATAIVAAAAIERHGEKIRVLLTGALRTPEQA